jgi:hypothetical protein
MCRLPVIDASPLPPIGYAANTTISYLNPAQTSSPATGNSTGFSKIFREVPRQLASAPGR